MSKRNKHVCNVILNDLLLYSCKVYHPYQQWYIGPIWLLHGYASYMLQNGFLASELKGMGICGNDIENVLSTSATYEITRQAILGRL